MLAALLRGTVLPRWTALPLAATVGGWLLFAAASDAVYDAAAPVAGVTVAANDVLAFVTATSWVDLGLAVLRLRVGPSE